MLDLLRNGLGWTEAAKGASALQCIELLYKATIKCLPQEVPAHQANYIALMELSAPSVRWPSIVYNTLRRAEKN